MKILLIYPLLAVMLSASCGTSKETSNTNSSNSTSATGNASGSTSTNTSGGSTATTGSSSNVNGEMKNDTNYRLIVSFISIGEGIDSKAVESMDAMISTWKEKKNNTFEVEKMPWGREGEVDYCFKLKELNTKEQDSFVAEVRTAFKDNSLVQIAENQPARHKR